MPIFKISIKIWIDWALFHWNPWDWPNWRLFDVFKHLALVECFNKAKISGSTNYSHRINAEISWQDKKLPVEFTNMEKYRMFQSKVFLLSEHPSFWNYFVNLEHCVTICDPRWRVSSFLTWKPAGGFPAFWNLTSGGFPAFWPGNLPASFLAAGFHSDNINGSCGNQIYITFPNQS